MGLPLDRLLKLLNFKTSEGFIFKSTYNSFNTITSGNKNPRNFRFRKLLGYIKEYQGNLLLNKK